MTLITPEQRVSKATDILRSLEESLGKLLQHFDPPGMTVGPGRDADIAEGAKQVAKAESLIGLCQKVEIRLAEYHDNKAGITQGSYALDLEEARSEIGGRLARLRAIRDT